MFSFKSFHFNTFFLALSGVLYRKVLCSHAGFKVNNTQKKTIIIRQSTPTSLDILFSIFAHNLQFNISLVTQLKSTLGAVRLGLLPPFVNFVNSPLSSLLHPADPFQLQSPRLLLSRCHISGDGFFHQTPMTVLNFSCKWHC